MAYNSKQNSYFAIQQLLSSNKNAYYPTSEIILAIRQAVSHNVVSQKSMFSASVAYSCMKNQMSTLNDMSINAKFKYKIFKKL